MLGVSDRAFIGGGGGAAMEQLCKTPLCSRQSLWLAHWSLLDWKTHIFFPSTSPFSTSICVPITHPCSCPLSSLFFFLLLLIVFVSLSLLPSPSHSLSLFIFSLHVSVWCFFFLLLCWPSGLLNSCVISFHFPSSYSHSRPSPLGFLPLCLSGCYSCFDTTSLLTPAVTSRPLSSPFPPFTSPHFPPAHLLIHPLHQQHDYTSESQEFAQTEWNGLCKWNKFRGSTFCSALVLLHPHISSCGFIEN